MRMIDASRFGEIMEQWKKDCLADNDTHGADIISDVILQLDDMPTLTPPNEWVSVEERLPEKHSEYIVCACDEGEPIDERIWGDTVVVCADYYDGAFTWYEGNTEYDISDIVTHWMPLPAPPGKDNNVPTKAPNEPLTCDGCISLGTSYGPCMNCIRSRLRGDMYRRPPEGEEDT